MADKLIDFIEAVLPNPDHYAYTLGLRQNAALQYYAVNVKLLNTIKPEAFREAAARLYGPQIGMIEGVMAKCEQLAETLGVKSDELTNSKLIEVLVGGLKEKAAVPVAEAAKPVEPVVEAVKPELNKELIEAMGPAAAQACITACQDCVTCCEQCIAACQKMDMPSAAACVASCHDCISACNKCIADCKQMLAPKAA